MNTLLSASVPSTAASARLSSSTRKVLSTGWPAVDDALAVGKPVGPPAGVPIGAKDLDDVARMPTRFGSAAVAPRDPARARSTLVELLVELLVGAGCVVIGKTATPGLGWKAGTESPAFGAMHNPWDLARSP